MTKLRPEQLDEAYDYLLTLRDIEQHRKYVRDGIFSVESNGCNFSDWLDEDAMNRIADFLDAELQQAALEALQAASELVDTSSLSVLPLQDDDQENSEEAS